MIAGLTTTQTRADSEKLRRALDALAQTLPQAITTLDDVRGRVAACWPTKPTERGWHDEDRDLYDSAMRLVEGDQYHQGALHKAIGHANRTLAAYEEVPQPESGMPHWRKGRVDPATQRTPPRGASDDLRAALPAAEAAIGAINRRLDAVMLAPTEIWLREWGVDDARVYIDDIDREHTKKWQHSRGKPKHWYTAREWHPYLRPRFMAFAQLIQRSGSLKTWGKHDNVRIDAYLKIDELEYWTMGRRIQETTVINRAPVDAPNAAKALSDLTPEQLRRALEYGLANRLRSAGDMAGRTGVLDGRLRARLDASYVR